MLCLRDSLRQDAPAVQRWLHAVDDAHTLTAILLAVWPLARVLARHSVEAVLAERALSPTLWPRCPTWGAFLRSTGFVKRQVLSLLGPICGRRRGRGPQGGAPPPVAPLAAARGGRPYQRPSCSAPVSGLCAGRLWAVCDGGDGAAVVKRGVGQCSGRVGGGPSRGAAGHGAAPRPATGSRRGTPAHRGAPACPVGGGSLARGRGWGEGPIAP
jgi:hypothetical protein